jgi:ATP-dependent Clp protease ATP-binding subunit ClpA
MAGLLKPILTDPHIKVVGSTTYAEYRKNFAKDAALSRRFQAIFIEEPSKEESLKILKGAKKEYEDFHKLSIDDEALERTIELAAKHILDRKFPDKAFDILDETCAHRVIKGDSLSIYATDIDETMRRVYKVSDRVSETSNDDLISSLEKTLQKSIYGQNSAIAALNESMLVAYSGLNEKDKPLGSFLFTGPTGVGKTELTKQLASHLGLPLIKFDMSEYMEKHSVSKLIGAPPGYVGHDDGGRLTDEVSKTPNAVLLLDEIEKAHPDVINVLLQVMDSASLTDSIGKTTHFNQCIIIMTSNSGARAAQKGSVGIFEAPSHDFSDDAIKSFFSPEFINRLTAIIKFNSLDEAQLLKVIEKNLEALKDELSQKGVNLDWNDEVSKWILEKGLEKGMGARPFARFISKHIKVKVAKKLIAHKKATLLNLSITIDGLKKLHILEA